MRTVDVSFRGEAYGLPISFVAIRELHERGVNVFGCLDLLAAKRPMDAVHVIELITVGLGLAGCKIPRDEIGQSIVDAGTVNFVRVASAYVVALCSGQPSAPVSMKGKKNKK